MVVLVKAEQATQVKRFFIVQRHVMAREDLMDSVAGHSRYTNTVQFQEFRFQIGPVQLDGYFGLLDKVARLLIPIGEIRNPGELATLLGHCSLW